MKTRHIFNLIKIFISVNLLHQSSHSRVSVKISMGNDPPQSGESTTTSSNDSSTFSRRGVLKAAGAGALAVPVVSSRPGERVQGIDIDEFTYVGKTTFAEVGLSHRSEDLVSSSHIDQAPSYVVDSENDRLLFALLSTHDLSKIHYRGALIQGNWLHSTPVTINEDRTSDTIPVTTNAQYKPYQLADLRSEYDFPAVEITESNGGELRVSPLDSDNRPTDVRSLSSTQSDRIELESKTVEQRLPNHMSTQSPQETTVTPVVEVENHGELDVYVGEVRW
jgi:hypothetical protein